MDAANIALQSHVDVKQRSDLFLRAATRLQNPYHYLMIITIMITRKFPLGCKTTISTLTEVLFFALLHLPWHGCFCCVYRAVSDVNDSRSTFTSWSDLRDRFPPNSQIP